MNEEQKQLLDNWEKCITVNLDNILWGIVSDLLKAQEAKTRDEERERAARIVSKISPNRYWGAGGVSHCPFCSTTGQCECPLYFEELKIQAKEEILNNQ